MVFMNSKLRFDQDDSLQLSFQQMRQLECGDQFASSGHRHNAEKQDFPDGVSPGGNLELVNMSASISHDNSVYTVDNTCDFSRVMSSNAETVRLDTSKRLFGDDGNLQVAAKRTRQLDGNFPPSSSSCEEPFIASASDDEFKSQKDAAVLEGVNDSHGSSFNFPWFSCSTYEDTRHELPVRLSFYPGYYEDHHWPVAFKGVEESVFDYLPQKHVAIGPDHQVDIPVCRSKQKNRGVGFDASTSSGKILTDDDTCDKWTGNCVMSMSDPFPLGSDGPLGSRKSDCHCLDESSIRCVRQHVKEAREELRSSVGHERFVTLGLCDMGEDVASGWTEAEEWLFHEVIEGNPASWGKNFWNILPQAFPSRSSKELVSYYFNVFMLRKRAEQNRCDLLNVDSDNDEWQESNDGEFGATEEEEEDAGVESPADDATLDNRVLINS